MPARPRDPGSDDVVCALQVRVPGVVKRQIISAADEAGRTVNDWVLGAIRDALSPEGTPVQVAYHPTFAEVILDYTYGRTTISPCGKVWPCEGAGVAPEELAGQQ